MKIRKSYFTLVFLLVISALKNSLLAAGKYSWDFSDSEIRDVLYALSLESGISIICDDTVSGKTDFRFSGSDFEKAFEAFLDSTGLFFSEKKSVRIVSRVKIGEKNNTLVLECSRVRPVSVLDKLSKELNINITYDLLPATELTVHLENESAAFLLEDFVRFLSGYSLESTERGFHISKKMDQKKNSSYSDYSVSKTADGKYSVEVRNAGFQEVAENLLKRMEKPFCFIEETNEKASRTSFYGKTLEDSLDLLCRQNGFSLVISDGICYVSRSVDKKNEIPGEERQWCFFNLNYTSPQKISPVFSRRFPSVETAVIPESSGFWAKVNFREKKEVSTFIKECDLKKQTYVISLNNIRADEFLKRLPPSIDRNDISEADGNCCLYFSGTEEAYRKVMEEVAVCDRPKIRLKYDLLIIQYDDCDDNKWTTSFNARRIMKGDINTVSAQLGSVLALNLNVLTVFGLDFAASLQASLSENKSRIFADTTLHGIAGKEINFSNTSTYRYRDNNLDPETGKPVYSGITREIVSGLKLDIKPWVGEDGVITSNVVASVTRRGTDLSSLTGNPPPTTEKTVTTEVCGKSGEPIILSGLVQNAEDDETAGIPLLSKIPILGYLFKSKKVNKEKSQMMIYLVPSIETDEIKTGDHSSKYNDMWIQNRKESLCRILNSD